MADTRKPKPDQQPGATGKPAGTAAKARQQAGRGATQQGKGRPAGSTKGKLAKGAAARRLEARRRRQRALTWTAAAVLVAVVLLGVIALQGRDDDRVSPQALTAGRQQAGCGDVRQFPQASQTHIPPNKQATDWNSNPPTSGQHLATPLRGGVYGSEQDMRALVHNLEHGYVVILYKNIPEDQQQELRDYVEDKGGKLVLAPYSGLEQNGVALTAWRNLETCQRVNLDVVKAFVNDFQVPGGPKSTAPEPLAA
jgi:hypothetical protein